MSANPASDSPAAQPQHPQPVPADPVKPKPASSGVSRFFNTPTGPRGGFRGLARTMPQGKQPSSRGGPAHANPSTAREHNRGRHAS